MSVASVNLIAKMKSFVNPRVGEGVGKLPPVLGGWSTSTLLEATLREATWRFGGV